MIIYEFQYVSSFVFNFLWFLIDINNNSVFKIITCYNIIRNLKIFIVKYIEKKIIFLNLI